MSSNIENVESPTVPRRRDRFTFFYAALTLAFGLLWTFGNDLDRIFNLWLALVPLILLPAFALLITLLVSLVLNLVRRQWRRAASALAAPFIAFGVFWSLANLGVTPETIRFRWDKPAFEAEIAKTVRMDNEPRLKLFYWGQTGGAGVDNYEYIIVYDESDEIALPRDKRSPAWVNRAQRLCPGTAMCAMEFQPERTGFSIGIKKMDEHFFLVTMAW